MRESVRFRAYRFLLALHPKAFQEEFAAEMLWIFEEQSAQRGSVPLFTDALVSLGRQWMFRSAASESGAESVPAAAGQLFAWEHIGIPETRLPVLRVMQGSAATTLFLMALTFAAVRPVHRSPATAAASEQAPDGGVAGSVSGGVPARGGASRGQGPGAPSAAAKGAAGQQVAAWLGGGKNGAKDKI